MNLSLMLALFFLIHPYSAMGGRAQRRQRQAEESLGPYIGRVKPEKLCELLKCHSPMGSWCQVIQENEALVPKCVCPGSCPRQRAPVCSVVGKTYGNECLLHKEACRKRRRIGLAHTGPCLVPKAKCTEEELGQFPYRLLDWFLLLSRMGESYTPAALPQNCLSHAQRTQLAQDIKMFLTPDTIIELVYKLLFTDWLATGRYYQHTQRFTLLDKNKDGKLSRRDLRKLHYKKIPLEHCATPFFQSCDSNRNKKVTLKEWTTCLVDHSEAWFYHFMSMKMGSSKLCAAIKENDDKQP